MAASIMPFFVIMCEFFNGVLQPQALMPKVWAYTMYYVGPFTYWISGIVAQILTDLPVRCQEQELSRFQPPSGQTCSEYAQEWLSTTKGYISNPNATSACGYCQYAVGQDVSFLSPQRLVRSADHIIKYLSTINVTRSDAWPYLAIFAMFTITNYLSVYLWVYIKSVKNWLPW
jgi:ABC-type multidrug transport system permease subunit